MRKLAASLSVVLGLAAGLSAQSKDIINYQFVAGTGTNVKNFATGGPATGKLVNTNTKNKGWATGKTNNALAGKDSASTLNYVDSGFNQGSRSNLFSGSFTVAFFMKEASPPPSANSIAYLFSGVETIPV